MLGKLTLIKPNRFNLSDINWGIKSSHIFIMQYVNIFDNDCKIRGTC